MIHGHGSDRYLCETEIKADFSSNVWYEGLPPELAHHIESKIKDIIHYPEPDAGSLNQNIAEQFSVDVENVLVTNGATEAFYLLAQLKAGETSYITYPAFAEYEDACSIFKLTKQFIKNTEITNDVKFIPQSTFWLGNPNNPDGKIFDLAMIRLLCSNNPETLFVIDEAYADLCTNFESAIALIHVLANVVIVRSLTKAFAIPGIRLGYIIASPAIIQNLKSIKMPWSVNALAIEAGHFILSHYQKLLPCKVKLHQESKDLQHALSSISGLEVLASDCNYFLVKLQKGRALDLKQYLLSEYGYLIRDASNFRGLDQSFLRIAVQETSHNLNLKTAIERWLHCTQL
jgi:threonine-phosphate decarboxylase